jgi:mannose/fructose/N-acetylgalactosamine-specific phosphotransferase system component IID
MVTTVAIIVLFSFGMAVHGFTTGTQCTFPSLSYSITGILIEVSKKDVLVGMLIMGAMLRLNQKSYLGRNIGHEK